MDFPIAFNTVTRSSSDDSVGKKSVKPFSNFQDISSSVDSWKEKRKLKLRSKGMLDMLKKGQSKSTEEITREHARYRIISSASDETSGETRGSDEQEVKPAQQKRGAFYGNVLSTDKNKISSYTMSASHRSSNSGSNSSNSVSPQLTLTTLLSSQLHLLHDGEKAEGSSGTEKGVSATRQATTDIRSSRTINTDRSGFAPQSAAELVSSSFLLEENSPVSNCSFSPFSKRSVSNTSSHDGDTETSLNEGEEEIFKHRLNRAKRANEVVDEREALTNAEDDGGVVSHLDNRNNSKAIGNSDNDYDNDGICDDDDGVERRDHQQKTIVTQNLENDEMLDVDFTAIEATQTLNNENARQKLLLRRKSSLANRQRPTRTRKRFSESDSESESSYLNAESDQYERKKTRDIHYVDLPETDEYKCITENSSKTRNEDSEVPLQPVLKERRDLGLQLKKEKDQENRAVLDTTPVVLRKNSYNSFENTAGSRKPLIQEVNFEGTKSEKTTPFENIRRSPRHHELLRGTKDFQSLEDLSDKVDSPPVGSESHNQRQKNLDSRKETHCDSFPGVETQPRILRAVSRIDKRIFEDGPKTRISTEDDWLTKRHSTPTAISVSQKESSSPADSNSGQKTEKWSVLRQPLDSGNDNRNTCDKQTWLKKNLDQRRTISYTFTSPAKELDTKESQEAPWIKEFRNSRKRVSLVFSNRDQVKPVLDKPPSVETTSVRISKPLSSLAGEQSSRAFVSGKVAVHTTSSSAVEKKETSTILPEGTASPKYKVERKSSFNNTNECGVSSRMKENRSPVSRNNINTAEPYLPSWSVADAGEAPASLTDTRSDIPDWQRKLAEKNKLRKQSFRRTKSEGSELYGQDYEIDPLQVESVLYPENEKVTIMYSQNNNPYANSGTYPQSSASVPNVNCYEGQWYAPQGQSGYYDGYDPNYYYNYNQQFAGSGDMSYSMSYMPAADYAQYYNQNQNPPLTKAYSYDSINQYEKPVTPKHSPKLGDLSLSPQSKSFSDSRSASPKSPRFVRVLPPTASNEPSPSSSPKKSERSEKCPSSSSSSSSSSASSAPATPISSPPPSPRPSLSPRESPDRQKSSSKGLPSFSLSNVESHSGSNRRNFSSKPMYVRVLPPPVLPNKLSPEKLREYTDLSPENSPSRIPVPVSQSGKHSNNELTPKSFKNRLFGRKHEESGSSASSIVSDEVDKKTKSKYKFKIPVSPKFTPFGKKQKSIKQNQSDEENGSNLPVFPQQRSDEVVETKYEKITSSDIERGPYYRILRSPLKTKSMPNRSYSMTFPTEEINEHKSKLRPVPSLESAITEDPPSTDKTNILRRGRRIEDSSSPKANIEDGSPKSQPAWRQKLKNRTQSMVEQAEKKAPEKPDWIKQAEERSARLAKTKLLGD